MLYPVMFLEELGRILLQIDFIGPRYLEGSSDPLHFISLKYVRPFKLHIFIRIKSQTTTEVLNAFYVLFFVFNLPVPDIVQMDNDASFRGYIEREGCIGRLIRWLCGNGIIALFNAQSSPWNNGSVEGGNSVFDKKFWQMFHFNSINEIDEKLQEFNRAYKSYLIKNPAELIQNRRKVTDPRKNKRIKFIKPYFYLLRIVKEQYDKCYVEVLNNYINLPKKYKGQFVIIMIQLDQRKIKIYQEIKNQKILIYQSPICLNL